jgi:type VI secretion system secreted protein VgrG
MALIFRIRSSELPADATVVGFRGVEAISALYRFEIGVQLPHAVELDLDALAGTRATLTIDAGEDASPYEVHGVIASAELVHAWAGQSLYQLVLVPKLWEATLTHHSRVFVDTSTPDIIEDVLKKSGLGGDDYELRLDGSYDPRTFVCQYQESNFAFVSRWLEREGMYYFFEQGDDHEKLVIVDAKSAHTELGDRPVRYVPMSGTDEPMKIEALVSFACRRAMLPADVLVRDYDYLKPSLDLRGEGTVDGLGRISVYGDNFRSNGEGKRLATVRAEAWLARRRVFAGHGRVFHLRPGYKLKLDEHPQPSLNAEYLCTELRHQGNLAAESELAKRLLGLEHPEQYRVDVTAIAADIQFRAERATPIPRIDGVITALVDGPSDSDYAQIDEHGRYKVKLLLDESELDDGKASTWIRMLQFHAGSPEGVHFPLRKGTEVLIVFLGGDPDCPLICGAVPNVQTPSPVTDGNHTFNVLMTGGRNHLVIQDLSDKQYVDLYSPKFESFLHLGHTHDDDYGNHTHEIVLNTEANCLFNIGGNQDIEVGGDLTEHVAGDVSETYDNDQDTYVGGDETIEVANDRDIEVGGDQTLEVACDYDIEVGGDMTIEVGGDRDIEVGGDQTVEVGADYDIEVGGDMTIEVGGDYDVEVGVDITFENGGAFVGQIGTTVDWSCAANWTQIVGGKYSCTPGETDFWTIGNEAKGTIGSTFEIFIGNKASVQIGNFLDASISNKLGLALGGVHIDLTAALKLEVTGGAKISANSAVVVEVDGAPKVETAATILQAAAMIMKL